MVLNTLHIGIIEDKQLYGFYTLHRGVQVSKQLHGFSTLHIGGYKLEDKQCYGFFVPYTVHAVILEKQPLMDLKSHTAQSS